MQTRPRRRLWCGLAEYTFGGSLELCAQFRVGAPARNLASVAVKMFSYLILLKKVRALGHSCTDPRSFCSFGHSYTNMIRVHCCATRNYCNNPRLLLLNNVFQQ
jgi:hypothetical protein